MAFNVLEKDEDLELARLGLGLLATGAVAALDILSHASEWGSLPNVRMKVMDGQVFWENKVNVNGWRVQQHRMLGNCRILSPGNYREAWGGYDAMMEIFRRLAKV